MTLEKKISDIVKQATGKDAEVTAPTHASQGHYSTNLAMQEAQQAGTNPRNLAAEYVEKIKASAPDGLFERVEVAGPGFINFFISHQALRSEFLQTGGAVRSLNRLAGDRAGETVIVEYSQPNIAKQLHGGHLRTTIIGDAIANLHEALGYNVVRWNYLGDWGTQFGALLVAYKKWGGEEVLTKDPLKNLEELYVKFNKEAEANESLKEAARQEFKKLEDGDEENKKLWEKFKQISIEEIEKLYTDLGVSFDTYEGEAFAEQFTDEVIAELKEKGIAKESEGALVVELEGEGLPTALVQKSDGANLYLTRDLAILRHRLEKYSPKKILYVVGNEQALHFEQLFAIANRLGWAGGVELVHVKYGLMLGADGKKMSTRRGTAFRLRQLIDDIVARAAEVVHEKNPDLSGAEKQKIARAVGIGALKYNDLHERRTTDIAFDLERMLDFAGNSAPYLEYTYARLMSIVRKRPWWQKLAATLSSPGEDALGELGDTEHELMRQVLRLPEIVEGATEALLPNVLAEYLHQLATAANKFYETTPILGDANKKRQTARILLVERLAATLSVGLAQLGIETPEKI